MALSALVSNIQGYSIHDGPGIRSTVFLKGCPLRCRWCANPENLEERVAVGFQKELCAHCGRCAAACPRNAVMQGPLHRIDRTRCDGCGACTDACYYGALVRYGQEMTVEEVFDRVRRDRIFYESSGGGVTVSGGEPLLHAEFVAALFHCCRNDGIGTCIETCGCVPRSAIEAVRPLTDIFYFDLKIIDSNKHREYTGLGNESILENARYLTEQKAEILFRQPMIPGVNTGEEDILAMAGFLRSLAIPEPELQLIPYHRTGTPKYAALDLPYTLEDLPAMSAHDAEAVCRQYEGSGVRCTVSL